MFKTKIQSLRKTFHLPEAKILLNPHWRKRNIESIVHSTGFCYIASEALFHMIGGVKNDFRPCFFKLGNGETHWWLVNSEQEVLDPTADQFSFPFPYSFGKRTGYRNGYAHPSKKANTLILLSLQQTGFKKAR